MASGDRESLPPSKLVQSVERFKIELLRLLNDKYISSNSNVTTINTSNNLSQIQNLRNEVVSMLAQVKNV